MRIFIGGGVFFAFVLLFHISGCIKEKGYKFSGIVQDIKFDVEGFPAVKINGKIYPIGIPNRRFYQNIQIGDSLIKQKNSTLYKLVKHRTGKVIISK